ncbi:cyclic nucleotide-binding domain-containing protein [Jiulongibacter sp. NS-SX5]|uniref:cyclic nucleotide-binding domain-containing protein n=1 Tax=Jiulongibacter sp. NS-SX5 TaxID=3463854 RepID=UPI0040596380
MPLILKEKLLNKAELLEQKETDIITAQYSPADKFYLLLSGAVAFSLKVENEMEELVVGMSNRLFTPVGWSGFKEPFRYATTVTCTEDCQLICWEHEFLRELLEEEPAGSLPLLEFISEQSQLMLKDTWQMLAQMVPVSDKSLLKLKTYQSIEQGVSVEPLDLLMRSPFFEVFEEEELIAFEQMGEVQNLERGQVLFTQDSPSKSFDVHMHGKTALIYSVDKAQTQLDHRIVNHGGYLISTNCLTGKKQNFLSCLALAPSTVFRIDAEQLTQYLHDHPDTAVKFNLRLLWFYSNRLRSARAKLIRIKFDGEVAAVTNMIEQNCTQLDVTSELHKVPHLLKSTLHLQDAIFSLRNLADSGNSLERRIANSALDILTEVVRECDFYSGLLRVYSEVVSAPFHLSHREVRDLCAEQFLEVFENSSYQIEGLENLPDEPAIFIYNHLENHVYNTLPNRFQLTLDSHFISSVILYKKYQNPGVRVVRIPRGEEYGHQYYYERLGHIPVFTRESGSKFDSHEERKKQRSEFYATAQQYLEGGTSIMLAPEGTSSTTENSPQAFKAGAFLLATKMKKEPLIVPVAVANFDKRLNRTTFAAVIKKPFKISEKVENPDNRTDMSAFLETYTKEFRTFIDEAVALANDDSWLELLEQN